MNLTLTFTSEDTKMAVVLEGPMINPLYERLSDEEWEAAWPSSGPEVEGRSVLERAKDFGVDLTLLIRNLGLSTTERLRRVQQAAASLLSLQRETLKERDPLAKARR